jgi:FkbM family methyltransferase
MATVSYANNREDILLARAFGSEYTGFYIDVGANYPDQESVTKLFYDRGWSGVNVEPASEPFAALVRERRRDINLNIGLAEQPGEATFYEYRTEFAGRSTFDDELIDRYRTEDGQEPFARTVALGTLAAVWEEHVGDRVVDFLKIDVEGNEEAVLRGADFVRFRPRVVIVEATAPGSVELTHDAWDPLLTGHGYRLVLFDGLNRVYVEEGQPELAEKLSVPVNVFDDYEPVSMTNQRDIWLSTHEYASKLETENGRLLKRIGQLHEEQGELHEERRHLRAVGQQLNDALVDSKRDAVTARTMVAGLRAELEAAESLKARATVELNASREAFAALEAELLGIRRSWLGRLLFGLRRARRRLRSIGYRGREAAGAVTATIPAFPAVPSPPAPSGTDRYDQAMSWKASVRQALGWPLRRALNPRFEAVAYEIARVQGSAHAEAEATRQLTAAIERSISESIEQHVQSVIEVAANVGDRLDRTLVVLERIESRLDAADAERPGSRTPAE